MIEIITPRAVVAQQHRLKTWLNSPEATCAPTPPGEFGHFLWVKSMEVISKSQAKAAGMKYYFTGKPCFRGGIGKRMVSTSNCFCDVCMPFILDRKKKEYEQNKRNPEWNEKQRLKRIEKRKEKSEYDAKYRARNKDKLAKQNKDWANRNKEKVRAIKHNYKAKRRAIESEGATTAEVSEWLSKQDMVCYWCGTGCSKEYHIDHYHPLARGGKHEVGNLVIACPACNMTKKAKDPYVFAKEVGRLF